MARKAKTSLTARKLAGLTRRGRYADADVAGLYFRITVTGTRGWAFRYMRGKERRELGLGAFPEVSLSEARERARQARKLLRDGKDPLGERRAEQSADKLAKARGLSFKACGERYIAAHEASWRNAKHRAQWRSTLETYVFPVFGELPVQDVDVQLVMKALEPIWHVKPETGSRVRGRIEAILDWAQARGYRQGESPARWRGHLDKLLPKPTKVRSVAHHAALPFGEVAAFMTALRGQEGIAALALQFTILTAARTGEAIGARWDEIGFGERLWTVPAERMKVKKAHRVPLSAPALAILEALKEKRIGDYIFPGARKDKPLSNMALLVLLRRMKRFDLTVHGFRSSFRDWAAERTAFPSEVAEMALAHTVSGKVEAAYRRGDLFDKRRKLMEAWGEHCTRAPASAEVVPFGRESRERQSETA